MIINIIKKEIIKKNKNTCNKKKNQNFKIIIFQKLIL